MTPAAPPCLRYRPLPATAAARRWSSSPVEHAEPIDTRCPRRGEIGRQKVHPSKIDTSSNFQAIRSASTSLRNTVDSSVGVRTVVVMLVSSTRRKLPSNKSRTQCRTWAKIILDKERMTLSRGGKIGRIPIINSEKKRKIQL